MCVMMTALAPSAWAMEAPQLNGKAAVVIDLDSGKMLSTAITRTSSAPRQPYEGYDGAARTRSARLRPL